jgi:CHRD domain
MKIHTNTIGKFVVVTSLSLITALISIAYLSSASVFAIPSEGQKKFSAQLSGDQEVPPVQTNASGMAWFKSNRDTLEFELNVTDLQGITMAHIHNGKQGEIGPPVLPLYKSDSPTILMNGKLASGNITANMLEGPMAGKQIANLTTAMKNSETYVNVHTQQNPNGEIRGQIIISNSTN